MTTLVADCTLEDEGRAGAHRYWDSPDADGRWSCWDCEATADTRAGLAARDDCPGSRAWCSMCRRRRHGPDYECECSLSGCEFARCGVCGRWELEPDATDAGQPTCRVCEQSSFDVGAALDAMLARASLLPIQQHAERYATLARCSRLAIPEKDEHASRARDYADAFKAAAEALGGLAQLHAPSIECDSRAKGHPLWTIGRRLTPRKGFPRPSRRLRRRRPSSDGGVLLGQRPTAGPCTAPPTDSTHRSSIATGCGRASAVAGARRVPRHGRQLVLPCEG